MLSPARPWLTWSIVAIALAAKTGWTSGDQQEVGDLTFEWQPLHPYLKDSYGYMEQVLWNSQDQRFDIDTLTKPRSPQNAAAAAITGVVTDLLAALSGELPSGQVIYHKYRNMAE